ncbi:MAG: hypothetical protein JWM21_4393 [Acidobacteria bacterium]|nr:hypothetical protein [Acidobacteriota bacterium]
MNFSFRSRLVLGTILPGVLISILTLKTYQEFS